MPTLTVSLSCAREAKLIHERPKTDNVINSQALFIFPSYKVKDRATTKYKKDIYQLFRNGLN
jgi:hypothetical protein